jgi:Ca2+-binding EF-hand superfamily protein
MSVPADVLASCRETFATLQLDAHGRASSQVLRHALQGPDGAVPPALWTELFDHMDVDRDGSVSLAEFVAAMAGLVGLDGRTATHRLMFDLFDADGDGFLAPLELQTALRALGRPTQEPDAVVALSDLDGDGRLEYVEFLALLGG